MPGGGATPCTPSGGTPAPGYAEPTIQAAAAPGGPVRAQQAREARSALQPSLTAGSGASPAEAGEPGSAGLLRGHGLALLIMPVLVGSGLPYVGDVAPVAVFAQSRVGLRGSTPADALDRLPPFVGERGTAVGADIAAGPSKDFALMSGLEEVIERDASMVWWHNATRRSGGSRPSAARPATGAGSALAGAGWCGALGPRSAGGCGDLLQGGQMRGKPLAAREGE